MLDLAGTRLILASASPIRRTLLENAGLVVEVRPANIDEGAIRAELAEGAEPVGPGEVARALAVAKAAAVSSAQDDRRALVIGADQVLADDSVIFEKPGGADAVRASLRRLRGRTHQLFSAVAVARAGGTEWSHVGRADLTMRAFDDDWLERYIAVADEDVWGSVGGYQLEGLGVHLFEAIDGDYFTVLGLPLVALLAALRRLGGEGP